MFWCKFVRFFRVFWCKLVVFFPLQITEAIFDTFTDCAQTSSLGFFKQDGTYIAISLTDNFTLGGTAPSRIQMMFNNETMPAGQLSRRFMTVRYTFFLGGYLWLVTGWLKAGYVSSDQNRPKR